MLVVFSLTVLADTKIILGCNFGNILKDWFIRRNFPREIFEIFVNFRLNFNNLCRKTRKFSGTVICDKVFKVLINEYCKFFKLLIRRNVWANFLFNLNLLSDLKSGFHLPKKLCYLLDWKSFQSYEKYFLFCLKSSFCSQDI